jgi:DNA-binding phage protein
MSKRQPTAFDRYLRERLKKPAFAKAFHLARDQIAEVDRLMRSLDESRVLAGIPKAELARRINAAPEIVRRLLTSRSPNPTLTTVVKLADALGLRLELVPCKPGPAERPLATRKTPRARRKSA